MVSDPAWLRKPPSVRGEESDVQEVLFQTPGACFILYGAGEKWSGALYLLVRVQVGPAFQF